jgi:hypothetical protein
VKAQVLAELFAVGEAVDLQEAARGAMGAVWRLETTTERPAVAGRTRVPGVYAAKNLFWFEGDAASIRTEVAFRAACADAGVPSPAPLPAVDGEYVVRLDGGWWRLYEWADGEVPDRRDAEGIRWLAEQMGVIHALDWSGGAAEVVPWYHRVDVDWPSLVETAEGAQVDWAAALKELHPRLVELTALVNAAPIGEQVWCHRDLKNTNVLRSADRSWLVDWDNVGSLAPWRELGALLMRHLDHPGNLRRIVTSYRASGGAAELDGPTGFATGVAISLNFLHGQASAAMDAQLSEDHRSFAARQVADLLSSLPPIDVLERAAEAVRST